MFNRYKRRVAKRGTDACAEAKESEDVEVRSATALKRLGQIRVGLIGPADPTMTGFAAGLQRSSDYVVVAPPDQADAARTSSKARTTPAILSAAAVVADPDVDLAAIFSTGEAAVADARTAIRAGRDIYLHSPLTIDMVELAALQTLAQDNNVRHIAGLPRRLSGALRFAGDLVKDGYVGQLQTANIEAETSALPDLDTPAAVSLPSMAMQAAELLDALFSVIGPPRALFGFQVAQGTARDATKAQTGKARVMSSGWAQLFVAGSLGDAAAFSVRFASRHRGKAAVRIRITGDDGDLALSQSHPFGSRRDLLRIAGARGSGLALRPLAVPKSYAWSTVGLPAAKSHAMLNIFAAFARDLHELTAVAPTLEDAVKLHRLSQAIVTSAETGRRVII